MTYQGNNSGITEKFATIQQSQEGREQLARMERSLLQNTGSANKQKMTEQEQRAAFEVRLNARGGQFTSTSFEVYRNGWDDALAQVVQPSDDMAKSVQNAARLPIRPARRPTLGARVILGLRFAGIWRSAVCSLR